MVLKDERNQNSQVNQVTRVHILLKRILFAARSRRLTRTQIQFSDRPRLEESSSLNLDLSIPSYDCSTKYEVGNSLRNRK